MKSASVVLFILALTACMGPPGLKSDQQETARYWPASTCKGCHDKIVEQHLESYHEKSFEDPVFQGQYFRELLPRAESDPDLKGEAKSCTACHAPIAYMNEKGHLESAGKVIPDLSGVTCDFCHTISGFAGAVPGNGNYISEPGDRKFGPFRHEYNWHHVYSPLQTKSEFCGICHNAVNHNGLEIKSTYSEWRESSFASDGIQCQNCHMNLQGFLTLGKASYESGKAASMTVGEAPYRKRLYTHRFPGAHSRTQIVESGKISVSIDKVLSADHEVAFVVSVSNEKTGHKMPSGSADLRLLWLEVAVMTEDRSVSVPADTRGDTGRYDIAGSSVFDGDLLGDDIPAGSRIYRAVFLDAKGKQTLSSYDAVKITFDNRLNAAEVREETYKITVPSDVREKITVQARLKYLPYPASFTRKFGLEKAEPFEVASTRKVIMLR